MLISPAGAQQTNWIGFDDDWFNPTFWDNGVPTATTEAIIGSGRANINDPGAAASLLNMAGGTGQLYFNDDATAAGLVIDYTNRTDNRWAFMLFNDNASLADATLNVGGAGTYAYLEGVVNFRDNTTAANGVINISEFGNVGFFDDATAGSATITATDGLIGFQDRANAGSARIILNAGGFLALTGDSTAGGATVESGAGAIVDVSVRGVILVGSIPVPFGSNTIAEIGHLNGAADIYLGSSGIQVGGLGLEAHLSGDIADGYSPEMIQYFIDLLGSPPLTPLSSGALIKVGTGTLTLSGSNTYTGVTDVVDGALRAGATNTFSAFSNHRVFAGAEMFLDEFDQTIGGLENAGDVYFGSTPGTLLTTSSYEGQGGTMHFNTQLGDDASPTDRLLVDGGTASGVSLVSVTNVGGLGALTQVNGILLVATANGASTVPGAFSLAGPVIAGPYEYALFRGSLDGTSGDNWYLRSELNCALDPSAPVCGGGTPVVPLYRPETSLYAALPAMTLLYGRLMLDTLHERQPDSVSSGAWARVIGQHGDRDGAATGIYGAGPEYDYDFWAFQGGADLYRDGDGRSSRSRAGAFFAIGSGSGDVTHVGFGNAGENAFTAYTFGGYWTHHTAQDAYIDAVAQGNWYDLAAKSRTIPAMNTDGISFGASVEGGYPVFMSAAGFRIEPQVQLAFQVVDIDDASDVAARVRFDDVNSLVGRLGVRFVQDFEMSGSAGKVTAWVRPSLWHEFLGDPETGFSSATGLVPFSADLGGTTFEINTGLSAAVGEQTTAFATASYLAGWDGAEGDAYDGKVGLKVAW